MINLIKKQLLGNDACQVIEKGRTSATWVYIIRRIRQMAE